MSSLQLHSFDYFKGRQHTETATSDQLITVHLAIRSQMCWGQSALFFARLHRLYHTFPELKLPN